MRRFSVCLLWLLLLALPLQGLAASARGMCHAAASMAGTAVTTDAGPHLGAESDTDIDTEKCHEPAPGVTTTHGGCVACAACHGAAALPPNVPALGQPTPTLAPATKTTRAVPAFVTDGPDRPPRTARV